MCFKVNLAASMKTFARTYYIGSLGICKRIETSSVFLWAGEKLEPGKMLRLG